MIFVPSEQSTSDQRKVTENPLLAQTMLSAKTIEAITKSCIKRCNIMSITNQYANRSGENDWKPLFLQLLTKKTTLNIGHSTFDKNKSIISVAKDHQK